MATAQRFFAVVVLAVTGFFTLPLAAWLLDGSASTQDLILPVHLIVMACIGAGLAWRFPALARPDDVTRTRLLMGAAWGERCLARRRRDLLRRGSRAAEVSE